MPRQIILIVPPLIVKEHDARRVLKAAHPRRAAGPDGMPGKVLKSSAIIPFPKKSTMESLKDFHASRILTPAITRCFERLVQHHSTGCLPPCFDPHQYAYRANRSTEDAIATALHAALCHLEQQGSYVRMLFVDYTLAFNIIIPPSRDPEADRMVLS